MTEDLARHFPPHERVQMHHYPCGCSLHVAFEETRHPHISMQYHVETHPADQPRVPRYVEHHEAEQIRVRKLNDDFWGDRTNPEVQPQDQQCERHAHLGKTPEWFETLEREFS